MMKKYNTIEADAKAVRRAIAVFKDPERIKLVKELLIRCEEVTEEIPDEF